MSSALNAAYSILPSLSREELRLLQSEITEQLRRESDDADPFRPLSKAALTAQLDAAIAEFDAGKGYSVEAMCQSIRQRFGWKQP